MFLNKPPSLHLRSIIELWRQINSLLLGPTMSCCYKNVAEIRNQNGQTRFVTSTRNEALVVLTTDYCMSKIEKNVNYRITIDLGWMFLNPSLALKYKIINDRWFFLIRPGTPKYHASPSYERSVAIFTNFQAPFQELFNWDLLKLA